MFTSQSLRSAASFVKRVSLWTVVWFAAVTGLSLVLNAVWPDRPPLVASQHRIFVSVASWFPTFDHVLDSRKVVQRGQVREIVRDQGGLSLRRMVYVERLRHQDVDVRVTGLCVSACTYYLALPRTCTTGTAIWAFHPTYLPRENGERQALTPAQHTLFHRALRSVYPEPLLDWVTAIPHDADIFVSGATLIAHGWARPCATDPQDEVVATTQRQTEILVHALNAQHNAHLPAHVLAHHLNIPTHPLLANRRTAENR